MHSGIFTYKGTCTRAGELIVKRPEQKAKKSKRKAKLAAAATTRRAKAAKAKKAATNSDSNNNNKSDSANPLARARARLAAARTKKNASSSLSSGRGSEAGRDDTDTLEETPPSTPHGGSGGAVAQSVLETGSPAAGAGGALGADRNFRETSHDALQQVEEEDVAGPTAEDDEESSDEPEIEPPTFKQVISGAVEEGLEVYERGARLRIVGGILLNVPWVVVLYCIGGGKVAYQSA